MIKEVLRNVDIPNLIYVEQDTPLTPDREIDFESLIKKLDDFNLIRFHFEAHIPEEHKYLMIGEPEDGFQKTIQWSQRPHLARTDYYKKIMDENFSKKSNAFIEDKMHGVVQHQAWEKNKIVIYHPEGDIKRSYHLDGRGGQEKYDDRQVW
jgi:hypothetical protein